MVSGQSERVDFLRARIAFLEASEGEAGLALRHRPSWPDGRKAGSIPLSEDALCSLDKALPNGLARGALHEIVALRPHDRASASGFALALAARFAGQQQGPILWILESQARHETGLPYAPGLALFGLDPKRVILIETHDAQESLWAMEEALKCASPAAVIGEIWSLARHYDLAASRRLVLAARKKETPGLLMASGLAGQADVLSSGAATRFEVSAHPGAGLPAAGGLRPLPGRQLWSIRLVKARAGPGAFGFDRHKHHSLCWNPEKACFQDALPFALSAPSADGPARPARHAAASGTGGDEGRSLRDLCEDPVGHAARLGRSARENLRA